MRSDRDSAHCDGPVAKSAPRPVSATPIKTSRPEPPAPIRALELPRDLLIGETDNCYFLVAHHGSRAVLSIMLTGSRVAKNGKQVV